MMERRPQRFCPTSELGNPQRTRVSTFPQRRRLRLSNWTQLLNRANRTFLQILVQNPFSTLKRFTTRIEVMNGHPHPRSHTPGMIAFTHVYTKNISGSKTCRTKESSLKI